MAKLATTLTKFDQPIIFVITITLCVVGMMAVMSWFFNAMNWPGPLSVIKGGINTGPTTGVAPQ
jgi:hypothetical protein